MDATRNLATRTLSIRALRKALKAAAQSTLGRHLVLDPSIRNSVPPGLCALGIMTKAPWAGAVKTRLQPPLTAEEAAALNACFLRDISRSILRATEQAPAKGIAVFTPIGSESVYENILPPDFFLIAQRGEDFGNRLVFAAEDLFKLGFASVCLINSDSPTVPSENFAEAAIELANPGDRIVLGPSEDGGYYLIGMKKLHRRVFEEIDWSTERVFEQTREHAHKIGIPVYELAAGLDIDDVATLSKLAAELSTNREAAPNTRDFLQTIRQKFEGTTGGTTSVSSQTSTDGRDRAHPST